MTVTLDQAAAFLAARLDPTVTDVAEIGAGAWSRCFAFTHQGRELVARFGKHVDDFEKDRVAYRYHAPDLPVPEVHAIGAAFDGYFALSTRVHGVPLEELSADQWRAVVPSVAAALEAMRTTDLSATSGYGGWDGRGHATRRRWSDHLLAVADDSPARRTHGWRERLSEHAQLDALFRRGYARLQQVASEPIPRSLAHCDLINRNVLADDGTITGVFDWGCSIYGDHLYDLAWFNYWSPWFPELDMDELWRHIRHRWAAAEYRPHNVEDRLAACYLHIGLDHFAYNAWLEDWPMLEATAERMLTLVPLS